MFHGEGKGHLTLCAEKWRDMGIQLYSMLSLEQSRTRNLGRSPQAVKKSETIPQTRWHLSWGINKEVRIAMRTDLKHGRQDRAGYQEMVGGAHASQARKGHHQIEVQETSCDEWTQKSPEP